MRNISLFTFFYPPIALKPSDLALIGHMTDILPINQNFIFENLHYYLIR